jgi:poly-gamma-glutamate synthesis protein (capsule biosynthesis protein)
MEKHIDSAKKDRADLILWSLHWGHEFEMYPTFHMMQIARELISKGVDVIMGHHPHVLHPFEIVDVNAERPCPAGKPA